MKPRLNNRKNDELRKIKITKDYTKHALSSVLMEFGDTKVLATISFESGKPKWMDKEDKRGWITAEYALLPTATHTRVKRERNKLSGRTQEIQRLIGRAMRSCVDLKKLGENTLIIDADILQADGGTRTASICASFIALKDAIDKLIKDGVIQENPILEPIAAISVGIVDNQVMLDLDYSEDSTAQADANVVMTESGKIVEFQTTAEGDPFEQSQLLEILATAKKGINKIIAGY